MKEFDEGGWHVIEEKTTKSFGRFKIDASHGMDKRLAGFFTSYEWQGNTCYIKAPGSEGIMTFEGGVVKCKVKFAWYVLFLRDRVLSEIRSTQLDVCGAHVLGNKTVFIVHGHDTANRGELEGILGTLGLQPVVLDKQDSMGMTIVEKLEYYAQTCAFAIVLMTPDDLTGTGARARQNVMLELGWFMAYLRRERVLLLYSGDVEIPSDLSGIIYLQFKKSVREVEGKIQQRLRGCGMIA